MAERHHKSTERPARGQRAVVDALLIGRKDVWGVVGRLEEDDSDLFTDGGDPRAAAPLRLCRAVLDDAVVLGDADPEQDLLLSELMLWECCDEV